MSLGEYLGAGSGTTKLLLHLNGNSTDSSGNSNSGTDTAITYSQANGKFGQGAGFNGSSSKITCGTSGIIDINSYTYSVWFKATDTDNNDVLIEIGDGTQADQLIRFSSNKLQGQSYWGTDASTPNSIVGNTTISTGIWYNIILVRDATNSKLRIYLNGNSDATEVSLTNTTANYGTTKSVNIGSRGSSNFFNGAIDEVKIKAEAWSASEVKKYYTFSKGRFNL